MLKAESTIGNHFKINHLCLCAPNLEKKEKKKKLSSQYNRIYLTFTKILEITRQPMSCWVPTLTAVHDYIGASI